LLNKPKILVTGANGLLGRHAIRSLCEEYEIYAAVHVMPLEPVEKVKYLLLDFSSEWSTDKLPKDLEAIIHLAQSSRFREFPDQSLDIFNVNISSTAHLLDFAWRIKVKKFVYASSGGIYGSSEIAFDENSPIISHGQLGFYLGSKLCGEILVQNYSQLMDVTTLRFFFMYGEGQRRTMLVPRLIDNIRNGVPINLQGTDGIRINPIHVSDAVAALRAIFKLNGSHTINIAGPETLSLRQIAECIGDLIKCNPTFTYSDVNPTHLIGDITAMQQLLNEPQVFFRNGIESLI
jgi:nucleoside-diphosphate-sugar epimerase